MRLAAVLLMIGLAVSAVAADNPPERPAKSPVEPTTGAGDAGGSAAASKSPDEGEPADDRDSPDEFVPSEEISEDISVPFPSDI